MRLPTMVAISDQFQTLLSLQPRLWLMTRPVLSMGQQWLVNMHLTLQVPGAALYTVESYHSVAYCVLLSITAL